MNYDASELDELKDELVENIREYSRSQKEEWQKIPMLALKADGRTGYSDTLSRAYMQGFWPLEESVERGRYKAYVDLETGELVKASSESGAAPVTELGAEIVDYVEEREPVNSVGTLKQEIAESTDWSQEDVRKKFMQMWHNDLEVSSEWEVSTKKQELLPASDEVVLKLANDLGALDASQIVETLESEAEEPVGDFYDYDEKDLEEKQRRKAKFLGLSEKFSRC